MKFLYTPFVAIALLMVSLSTVQAACYVNSTTCPEFTENLGNSVPMGGPGSGCHFIFYKLHCKGGPLAATEYDARVGYKELGNKCGLADREKWYQDGISIFIPPSFSTNICLRNILFQPNLVSTDTNFSRCGPARAVGALLNCKPGL